MDEAREGAKLEAVAGADEAQSGPDQPWRPGEAKPPEYAPASRPWASPASYPPEETPVKAAVAVFHTVLRRGTNVPATAATSNATSVRLGVGCCTTSPSTSRSVLARTAVGVSLEDL